MKKDPDGRTIIETQEDFFEQCVDSNNNIKASNVRLTFELNLSISYFNKDLGNVNFNNAIFEKRACFELAKFSEDAWFLGAKFSREADFWQAKFSREADFSNAKFLEKAVFREAMFRKRTIFKDAKFSEKATFWAARFLRSALFTGATFLREADFSKTKFSEKAIVSFRQATFRKKTIFEDATLSTTADFLRAMFYEDVAFFNATFLYADFTKVIFHSIADFSGTMNSKYVDPKIRYNNRSYNLILSGAIFMEYGQFKNAFIESTDRETFRIIKHEFLKINNRIEALEYHKKEMKAYWRDLYQQKWYKQIGNKFILFLNRYSTYYGTNPFLGVVVTLVIAFIFYCAFLLSSNSPDWSFEAFFRLLNPAHSYGYLEEFQPKDWAYIINGFSRVLIGYCYYQTIQAFRKFKSV